MMHVKIVLMEPHLYIRRVRVIDSRDSLCDCKGPQ